MKRVLAVCALVCLIAQADWAASQVRIPNALSEPEERNLIETWKSQKAADGATFLDVLKFAQSMRPKQFKYGDIEVNYGSAPGIGVQYYIGAKRLDGDAFNLFFETKLMAANTLLPPKWHLNLGANLNSVWREERMRSYGKLMPNINCCALIPRRKSFCANNCTHDLLVMAV
jgi:hypothetical protein